MTVVWRNIKRLVFLCHLAFAIFCAGLAAHADNYRADNYMPENSGVELRETNLPIVFINTGTTSAPTSVIHRDYYTTARMKIISNADGINYGDTLFHPNQTVDYDGWIALKYRGHSSFSLSEKKPYTVKTLLTSDLNGRKRKAPLMGMPADNDWALLAPYADRSLIRDVLMMVLARPYFEYVPRMRHCELVLDGTYYGVFVLSERITKGRHRLDLTDPGDEGDALTGDYLVEVDHNDEPYYYVSKYPTQDANGKPYAINNEVYYQYKHPDYDDMVPQHPQQLQFLQSWLDQTEDVLASHSSLFSTISSFIDIQSFIDYQLSQEFAGNVDAYRLSTPLYKRRDSADPRMKTSLWDFNIAFGNCSYGDRTDIWHYDNQHLKATEVYKVPLWWMRLMQEPEYVADLKQRWAEYRTGQYAETNVNRVIDSLANLLIVHGAVERNYTAHPIWGREVWPVPNYKVVDTYEKEIAYLKDWIARRTAWLDKQLDFFQSSLEIDDLELGSSYTRHDRKLYNLLGRQLMNSVPVNKQSHRRLYIVRYSDGTTRKVWE